MKNRLSPKETEYNSINKKNGKDKPRRILIKSNNLKNIQIKDMPNEPKNNNIKMATKKSQMYSQTYQSNFRRPTFTNRKNLNLDLQNINNGVNVNIILDVTKSKNDKKNKEEEKLHKTSPYNYKYFFNTANNPKFNRVLSDTTGHKKGNKEIESNFIKLSNEANMYTADATYITNKKLLLFERYKFENNQYKPNRAKLFDMTSIPHSHNLFNAVYKTTRFRGGRMFFFDDKDRAPFIIGEQSKNNNNVFNNKKPLYLQDLERYQVQKENEFYDKIKK